jgi:hypothetical protein
MLVIKAALRAESRVSQSAKQAQNLNASNDEAQRAERKWEITNDGTSSDQVIIRLMSLTSLSFSPLLRAERENLFLILRLIRLKLIMHISRTTEQWRARPCQPRHEQKHI